MITILYLLKIEKKRISNINIIIIKTKFKVIHRCKCNLRNNAYRIGNTILIDTYILYKIIYEIFNTDYVRKLI